MTTNPYLNRKMITNPAEFFGRERELRKILARIGNQRPQSVAVVGERRIGKSSLLYQAYHPANRQASIPDAASLVCVFMDLSERKDYQAAQIFQALFAELSRALGETITSDAGSGYDTFKAAVQRIEAAGRRLVIFFDEFEAIASNPNIPAANVTEFLAFLRGIANSHAVAYVTSSQIDLQELGHSGEIKESPFFNIFTRVSLGPFSREEALALIAQPSAAAGRPLVPYADTLLQWAGTHPYFLQVACAVLFEWHNGQGVSHQDMTRAAIEFADETEDHFQYTWQHLKAEERSVLRSLATGVPVPDTQHYLLRNLERRGYIVSWAGLPRIFSTIFAGLIPQWPS